MDELMHYPLMRELLIELLRLEPDETLPLPILVNLHKGVLRRPGARMAAEIGLGGDLGRYCRERWPSLAEGFRPWAAQLHAIEPDDELTLSRLLREAPALTDMEVALVKNSVRWQHPCSPCYLLHRLTWPGQRREPLLKMLEVQLGALPATRRMLLDLALKDEIPILV